MGVLSIFGEGTFILNFMGYGLLTKSLEAKCTFELSEEEILNVER
jgi:hypothetical protein